MRTIDFEAKSDRELLILVAQQGNETVGHLEKINSKIQKHDKRLTVLEARGGYGEAKSKWKANWQTITLIATIIALIVIEIGTKVA